MGRGSEALLEVWRAPLDLLSESFEYKKKTELVQISIQMWIYTVGGRADALPSASGESVFKQDLKKRNSIHKRKGSLQRRRRSPLKPIYRLDTSTLTLPPVGA
jgi:hypothetical protein